MKAAWIVAAVLVVLAIAGIVVWNGLHRQREGMRPPSPTAPEAPPWQPESGPAPPPAKPPATALFPPSYETPLYGLPLTYRVTAPEVPAEIAEPSPPQDRSQPRAAPEANQRPPVKHA
jgi:hypothetical protein